MLNPVLILAVIRRRQESRRRNAWRSVARPRTSLFGLTDQQVFRLYRFPPHIILDLVRVLEGKITTPTARSNAIPPLVKVLSGLHFLATGSFQRTSGIVCGLSQTSQSRILHELIPAINSLMPEYIKSPHDRGSRQKMMEDFYKVAGFPGVIGAIDCTHIALKPPSATEYVYRNRKHWHSLNVQVVCDAKCLIWSLCARFPGSTHDSYIFRNSRVCEELDEGLYGKSWILGDSAYAQSVHVMTPFRNPRNGLENRYNHAHAQTRGVVERTFGILKSRFRCLDRSGGVLLYSPNFVCEIVASCAILHNIAMIRGLNVDLADDLRPCPDDTDAHTCAQPTNFECDSNTMEGTTARNAIATRFFK